MKFFVLRNPDTAAGSDLTDFSTADNSRVGAAPRCPVCGKVRGLLPLLAPVRVELKTWGEEFGDCAFGPADDLLFSERFVEQFNESGLAGIDLVGEAEILKIRSLRPLRRVAPRYHCCRPRYSRAVVDGLRSGIKWERRWTCEECRLGENLKRFDRVVLESGSCRGEDILIARGLPGVIITTSRFKAFCEERKFKNLLLTPAEDFECDWIHVVRNP